MESATKKYSTLEIPMSVLLNALFDADYSEVENFEELYDEFCEAMGGEKVKKQKKKIKEKTLTRAKVELALSLIDTLLELPDADAFEALKELNYHARVPMADVNDVAKYCTAIRGMVSLDLTKLQIEEKSEELKADKKELIEPTRDYFANLFFGIRKYLEVTVTEKDTARFFAACVRQLDNHLDALRKQQNQK